MQLSELCGFVAFVWHECYGRGILEFYVLVIVLMFPATHNIIFVQWNAHNDHKHFRICTIIRNTWGKQSWAEVVGVDEYRLNCLHMLSVVHVGPGWNWTDIRTESTSDRTGTGLVTIRHCWYNCCCDILGSSRNGGAIAGWTHYGNEVRIAHVTAAL